MTLDLAKIEIFGDADEEVLAQMHRAISFQRDNTPKPCYYALMADNHLGYSFPVGSVVAYEGAICVNGVGYDIACGNKAVRLDCAPGPVLENIYRNMNEIEKHISFGIGRHNNEKVDHDLFDDDVWEEMGFLKNLMDKAREQLGTVGSGNHYVDVFIDELNRIWVGVHFGSRGLGHSIATHFVKAAGGFDGIHANPVIFSENSDLGQQYIKCMALAGWYAYAGRDWVCKRVAQILRGNIVEEVHNHHNYAWKERHFDRDLWVIRKGATPAFHGQRSFVGGTMGDLSVILEGMDSEPADERSARSLYSTVHGAGRAIGRKAAKGKRDKRGNQISPGLISREAMSERIKLAAVELRGADVDEAPQAYKQIEKVLEAHAGTIKILHKLKPIGVCMAPSKVYDPYKD